MSEKIAFDYLTLTSKKASLREIFFKLIKKTPHQFDARRRVLRLGGPFYRGWSFKSPKNPFSGSMGEFSIGQRNRFGFYEYIITFPCEVCNLFVFDFFKNKKLLSGEWKITRLDLQLTLDYEIASKKQLNFFYWEFYNAQSALEETRKGREREVKLYINKKYLLVGVGNKGQEQNQWKVYTPGPSGKYPKKVGVRFEVTLKKTGAYLKGFVDSGEDIEKWNFRVLQQYMFEATESFLLSKHRTLLKSWSSYFQKSKHEPKETSLPKSFPIDKQKRNSKFHKELALVAQALKSFAEMLKKKRHNFSHQQVKLLNTEFDSHNWRISWNREGKWAVTPTKNSPLWFPLFAPLNRQARAREERKEALKALAAKFHKVINNCCQLPERKKAYLEEPRANRLVREIFEVVSTNPVMDKNVKSLPRAKVFYSEIFDEKPIYIQEIIKSRQRQKYAKMKK